MTNKIILELFKGTGSVGKVFKKKGWKVISVDNVEKFKPSILADILKWDYKNIPTPDFIWASPPCNTFSNLSFSTHQRDAKTMKPNTENARLGDAILRKTISIINYWRKRNPKLKFVMENPHGTMYRSPYMKSLKPYTTAQTLYGLYGDKRLKRTDFFNNFNLKLKEPIIPKDRSKFVGVVDLPLCDRYKIPPLLIKDIYNQLI
tara:strand:+ start:199 stop:810 length:612 start_codon:yes stop_codon:yes gene_type:complete